MGSESLLANPIITAQVKEEENGHLQAQLGSVRDYVRGNMHTQEGRVQLIKTICEHENSIFAQQCHDASLQSKFSRTINSMLAVPKGELTTRSLNPVVKAFVEGMTSAGMEKESTAKKKKNEE